MWLTVIDSLIRREGMCCASNLGYWAYHWHIMPLRMLRKLRKERRVDRGWVVLGAPVQSVVVIRLALSWKYFTLTKFP